MIHVLSQGQHVLHKKKKICVKAAMLKTNYRLSRCPANKGMDQLSFSVVLVLICFFMPHRLSKRKGLKGFVLAKVL